MTAEEIKKMFETKRLKLSWYETFSHYSIVPFLLLISFFSIPDHYRIYFTNTYNGFRSGKELLSVSLLWFFLAVIFYFIQRKRLVFKELELAQTIDEFNEAIKRTVLELEWKIEIHDQHFVRATRPWNWTGSWGEMITILRDDKKILINSICDPNSFTSVASYGWNKRNIKIFVNNLQDVKQGVEQIIIDGDSIIINEWTPKKIFIRILLYPFSLFVIGLAIFMCIPDEKIFLAIGALLIAGAYLYWDIQSLLLNKQLKNRRKNK